MNLNLTKDELVTLYQLLIDNREMKYTHSLIDKVEVFYNQMQKNYEDMIILIGYSDSYREIDLDKDYEVAVNKLAKNNLPDLIELNDFKILKFDNELYLTNIKELKEEQYTDYIAADIQEFYMENTYELEEDEIGGMDIEYTKKDDKVYFKYVSKKYNLEGQIIDLRDEDELDVY